MRTKLLVLSSEQNEKKKVAYYLIQHADIGLRSGVYGGGGAKTRISRRTATKLLGWVNEDRIGANPFLATITVTVP